MEHIALGVAVLGVAVLALREFIRSLTPVMRRAVTRASREPRP